MLHLDQDNPKECENEFHRTPEVVQFPGGVKTEADTPTIPEQQETNVPKGLALNPVCPYCGADPCNLKARTLKMGPFDLLLVRCANDDCRKTLSVFPVGYNGPMGGPAPGLVQ
jgi:hypothetical protein